MMKQVQIKVLKDELRSAGYISARAIARRRVPKTAAVKSAQRVISKYDTAVGREERKLVRAYERLKEKARRAIYFGTEKQALLAIRAVHKYHMDHS